MLSNPYIVYFFIWSFIFLLYNLRLSELLTPMKIETAYLILGTGFFLSLGWMTASLFYKQKIVLFLKIDRDRYVSLLSSKGMKNRLRNGLMMWSFLTILEVIYFGNLPLLSLFGVGPSIRYTEFGIPGIHGFLNALFFAIFILYLLLYISNKKRVYGFIVILLMIWPFLVMHRMMFIAMFIQAFFVYYLFNYHKFKLYRFFSVVLIFLLVVYIFGYIGDIRAGREHILRLAGFYSKYPDWLPTGFAWVYLYAVTPINNINYNIENLIMFSYIPIETFSRIFPSFVRSVLFDPFINTGGYELYTSRFNVSTIFLTFLRDFGYLLTPFLFFIIGFINFIFCMKATKELAFIFFWIVFLYAIVISVFSNHMIHLVFLSEAFIGYLLVRGVRY